MRGHPVQTLEERLADAIGSPASVKVVGLLAAVLGLEGADLGTVSATASNLQRQFGIHDTRIGLLVTTSSLTGALVTIPAGALADRVRRTRLLGVSIALWAAAMIAGGAATSYSWLLASRLFLGAAIAAVGPAIASLTGDSFPAKDRARVYGFILAGEMAGTGLGFVVSGALAGMVGWRVAFWWLAAPSIALAAVMWRQVEPERGGQSTAGAAGREDRARHANDAGSAADDDETGEGLAVRTVRQHGVEPYARQVLHRDPQRASLWQAMRYALSVRTNVVIMAASALGYFYFGGVRTFAFLFAQGHYHVSKVGASLLVLLVGAGALAGVFVGGRLADHLVARGMINGRVIVPAVVLFTIPALLAPGFLVSQLIISIPLLTLGAALLGAANPPQDAVRLDVIHPHLWGRSEGVRTALRQLFEAAAPLTFGLVSDRGFGSRVSVAADSTTPATAAQGHALALTFVSFLGALLIAGAIVLIAFRTYPRDVATVAASTRSIGSTET